MSNPLREATGKKRQSSSGIDLYDVLIATKEYAKDEKEKAILKTLCSISPAFEAMVTRTEEASRDQIYLIESRMRRLEEKVERGFARMEICIRNLEAGIKDLDVSALTLSRSPPHRESPNISRSVMPSESSNDP
jgi:gas vesicle protein